MNERALVATPNLPTATTPPPKVIALKFHTAWVHPNDADVFNFDNVLLDFVYAGTDKDNRSNADQFLIEIHDLDTGVVKSYLQNTFDYPYQYWQRSVELRANLDTESDAIVDDAIVNARVTISPINHKGTGKRSTFLLPMKGLGFINPTVPSDNNTSQVLAKFWHLYSETPNDIYNRPKQIHIYMDVEEEVIHADKEKQDDEYYRYNTIGKYKEVNQQMFRWLIQDKNVYRKLDSSNEFQDMTSEEEEYINWLLKSIINKYSFASAAKVNRPNDPDVFKIAVENPHDHKDSIIIYIMKGKPWEL